MLKSLGTLAYSARTVTGAMSNQEALQQEHSQVSCCKRGTHIIEIVMDGFKEDAAQHGTSLAALLAMLVDEGAELRHDSGQILLQLEVCWDFDSHLVSLHKHG